MFRHSVIQTLRTTTIPARRTITTTALKMAEGDAGAPRSGGSAQGLVVPFPLLNAGLATIHDLKGATYNAWRAVVMCELSSKDLTNEVHFVNRDAFTKREDASENFYVRQKENEKLQALREKIKKHQEHLDELDKHVYGPLKRKTRSKQGVWF